VLKHRQDIFVLDSAFALIEGHPRSDTGSGAEATKGWATRRTANCIPTASLKKWKRRS
jgi:hypothetical protein